MGESYRTLEKGIEAHGEFEDRRSRFIAQIKAVSSQVDAETFISEVRARHHDARHNVSAWILSDGRQHCSDDGEPSRTAGMPTLEVLQGAELQDVCCVVTRYFGGTLLGPGGLVRAYTSATQEALSFAEKSHYIVEMTRITPVVVQLPYALYDRVVRLVHEHTGKIKDSLFTEDVQLTCVFRTGTEEAFIAAVRELASGEKLACAGEPYYGEF